ncbi:MAG: hypothetical protein H7X97_02430 [Opitutaceae bacterium]|nr:hypothetical protein [Verrucomicrobiales bacterium]
MRISRKSLAILAAGAIVVGAGIAVAASSKPPATASGANVVAAGVQPSVAGGGILQTTIFRNNNSVVNAAAGFNPVHSVAIVVNCPGPGNCIIEVDQAMQVANSPTANNRYAICSTVDGVFMSQPQCPFAGIVPTSGFETSSFIQFKTGVPPGNHNMQSFLYLDAPAKRSHSTIAYRVHRNY